MMDSSTVAPTDPGPPSSTVPASATALTSRADAFTSPTASRSSGEDPSLRKSTPAEMITPPLVPIGPRQQHGTPLLCTLTDVVEVGDAASAVPSPAAQPMGAPPTTAAAPAASIEATPAGDEALSTRATSSELLLTGAETELIVNSAPSPSPLSARGIPPRPATSSSTGAVRSELHTRKDDKKSPSSSSSQRPARDESKASSSPNRAFLNSASSLSRDRSSEVVAVPSVVPSLALGNLISRAVRVSSLGSVHSNTGAVAPPMAFVEAAGTAASPLDMCPGNSMSGRLLSSVSSNRGFGHSFGGFFQSGLLMSLGEEEPEQSAALDAPMTPQNFSHLMQSRGGMDSVQQSPRSSRLHATIGDGTVSSTMNANWTYGNTGSLLRHSSLFGAGLAAGLAGEEGSCIPSMMAGRGRGRSTLPEDEVSDEMQRWEAEAGGSRGGTTANTTANNSVAGVPNMGMVPGGLGSVATPLGSVHLFSSQANVCASGVNPADIPPTPTDLHMLPTFSAPFRGGGVGGEEDESGTDSNASSTGVMETGVTETNTLERASAVSADGRSTYEVVNEKYVLYDYELGRGSYSKVRLCYNLEDGRFYAAKVLDQARIKRRQLGSDLGLFKIDQEITIMKQLQHKNIIGLHEVIRDPTARHVYLILELAECKEVLTMKDNGDVVPTAEGHVDYPEATARHIVRGVMHALMFSHYLGIAHRDVKPSNVLLTAHNVVKLCDFGVSVLVSDTTMQLRREGSVAFLAPELLVSSEVDVTRFVTPVPSSLGNSKERQSSAVDSKSDSTPTTTTNATVGTTANFAAISVAEELSVTVPDTTKWTLDESASQQPPRSSSVPQPQGQALLTPTTARRATLDRTTGAGYSGLASTTGIPPLAASANPAPQPYPRSSLMSRPSFRTGSQSSHAIAAAAASGAGPISQFIAWLSSRGQSNTVDLFKGDVFSLGVTVFTLLLGRLPWRASSASSQLLAVLEEPDPFLRLYKAAYGDSYVWPPSVQEVCGPVLAFARSSSSTGGSTAATAASSVTQGGAQTAAAWPRRASSISTVGGGAEEHAAAAPRVVTPLEARAVTTDDDETDGQQSSCAGSPRSRSSAGRRESGTPPVCRVGEGIVPGLPVITRARSLDAAASMTLKNTSHHSSNLWSSKAGCTPDIDLYTTTTLSATTATGVAHAATLSHGSGTLGSRGTPRIMSSSGLAAILAGSVTPRRFGMQSITSATASHPPDVFDQQQLLHQPHPGLASLRPSVTDGGASTIMEGSASRREDGAYDSPADGGTASKGSAAESHSPGSAQQQPVEVETGAESEAPAADSRVEEHEPIVKDDSSSLTPTPRAHRLPQWKLYTEASFGSTVEKAGTAGPGATALAAGEQTTATATFRDTCSHRGVDADVEGHNGSTAILHCHPSNTATGLMLSTTLRRIEQPSESLLLLTPPHMAKEHTAEPPPFTTMEEQRSEGGIAMQRLDQTARGYHQEEEEDDYPATQETYALDTSPLDVDVNRGSDGAHGTESLSEVNVVVAEANAEEDDAGDDSDYDDKEDSCEDEEGDDDDDDPYEQLYEESQPCRPYTVAETLPLPVMAAGDGESPRGRVISAEAVDFIRACLILDPLRRRTIFELYHHPWITGWRAGMSAENAPSSSPSVTRGRLASVAGASADGEAGTAYERGCAMEEEDDNDDRERRPWDKTFLNVEYEDEEADELAKRVDVDDIARQLGELYQGHFEFPGDDDATAAESEYAGGCDSGFDAAFIESGVSADMGQQTHLIADTGEASHSGGEAGSDPINSGSTGSRDTNARDNAAFVTPESRRMRRVNSSDSIGSDTVLLSADSENPTMVGTLSSLAATTGTSTAVAAAMAASTSGGVGSDRAASNTADAALRVPSSGVVVTPPAALLRQGLRSASAAYLAAPVSSSTHVSCVTSSSGGAPRQYSSSDLLDTVATSSGVRATAAVVHERTSSGAQHSHSAFLPSNSFQTEGELLLPPPHPSSSGRLHLVSSPFADNGSACFVSPSNDTSVTATPLIGAQPHSQTRARSPDTRSVADAASLHSPLLEDTSDRLMLSIVSPSSRSTTLNSSAPALAGLDGRAARGSSGNGGSRRQARSNSANAALAAATAQRQGSGGTLLHSSSGSGGGTTGGASHGTVSSSSVVTVSGLGTRTATATGITQADSLASLHVNTSWWTVSDQFRSTTALLRRTDAGEEEGDDEEREEDETAARGHQTDEMDALAASLPELLTQQRATPHSPVADGACHEAPLLTMGRLPHPSSSAILTSPMRRFLERISLRDQGQKE